MLHAVLTFAATEGDEPNKVPFYICGILLVIWAVVVATLGIRNESFASARQQGRLIMAVSVLLVVATMASAVLTG